MSFIDDTVNIEDATDGAPDDGCDQCNGTGFVDQAPVPCNCKFARYQASAESSRAVLGPPITECLFPDAPTPTREQRERVSPSPRTPEEEPETPGGLTFAEIGRLLFDSLAIGGSVWRAAIDESPEDNIARIGRLAAELVMKGRA